MPLLYKLFLHKPLVTFALLIILSVSVTSCSFYRLVTGKGKAKKIVLAGTDSSASVLPVVVTKADTAIKVADTSAEVKLLINELTPMWKKRLDYKTYTGKAKMHLDGPGMNHDFTAHIRIRKDSVIWIHVTAAMGGIPVARLLISRDSIFMLNYLEKEFTMLPLTRAGRVLPAKVDFESMQNLIIGEPMRDGIITDARSAADSFFLKVEDTSYVQLLSYNKSDSAIRYGVLSTHNPSGPVARTQYSNYEITDSRRLSTFRVLNLENGKDVYKLEMNFTRSKFDEELEFKFSIPPNYTIKPVAP